MVDFQRLRAARTTPPAIDPLEIFRRLPKPPGINDLYTSQAEVLAGWFGRRAERDLVIKLHTGGGKTLVGLLIARSMLNEFRQPVAYLVPTVQLVEQTVRLAAEYSLSAVPYERGVAFPREFLAADSVLVCTYQALFNGMSRFGVRGTSRDVTILGGIILDDAHVASSTVRDAFTLSVEKSGADEDYAYLTTLFRGAFNDLGKAGTFDDIVAGRDAGVLEVPYWAWQARSKQVREYLSTKATDYQFAWPFLRDAFDSCHALVGRNAFVISPILPLVDMVPSFAECRRRVFMSATIYDDSALVRTFEADPNSVGKPISSASLAGVSERMILAPELTGLPSTTDFQDILLKLIDWASNRMGVGTVVLVPSAPASKNWQPTASHPDTSEQVATCVREMQNQMTRGPYVFANRYDGIDLPGDACRVLIMAGVPRGMAEYDVMRANSFLGGTELSTSLAQRIEQGIGRAARGAGDYCVVILTGKDLISWVSQEANRKFLTSSTRAQLDMGVEVSRAITTTADLVGTILKCLNRDRDWVKYHAETLADLADTQILDAESLRAAKTERKAFRLARDGYYEKAITSLDKLAERQDGVDPHTKGWLKQLAARYAQFWGKEDVAQTLQQHAYAANPNLIRPRSTQTYVPLAVSGRQAEAIVARIADFPLRRGYLADFDETVSQLVPEASANQFEQALANLALYLGFQAERPDHKYGVGPDVLWILSDQSAFVIEAKSRKNSTNALTKDQHGQLLNASEWFKREYPNLTGLRVSIHPNVSATRSTVTGETKALTLAKLGELVGDTRLLLAELCESVRPTAELVNRCQQLLDRSNLTPVKLAQTYLVPFEPITS